MAARDGRLFAALKLALPLVAFVALGLAWKLTPLGGAAESVAAWVTSLRGNPFAPLIVVVVFVVAGVVVAPLTALVLATVLTFGGVLGVAYAMLGSLASAAAVFGLGRLIGRATLERMMGPRLGAIARALTRRGVLAVAVIRNIPLAPYSVVNLVAGASDLALAPYLLGTFIGLLPGVVAFAVFGEGLQRFVRQPDLATGALLLLIVVALVTVSLLIGKRLVERGGER